MAFMPIAGLTGTSKRRPAHAKLERIVVVLILLACEPRRIAARNKGHRATYYEANVGLFGSPVLKSAMSSSTKFKFS
jgi:hypothetical protein